MFNYKNKKINNSEPLKGCFWCLVLMLTFCFFSYGYCVRGAIVNIVERQNMEAEISTLNTKVVKLESEYIKAKNNITPELAANLGFVTLTNTKFVAKSVNIPALSLITNDN
jgi:hypothetical protein